MLEKLFGSLARVKILKLFLLHPDEKHYIRQLARGLKLQVNSIRRELENLEKFGLLVSKISQQSEQEVETPSFFSVKKGKPSNVKVLSTKPSSAKAASGKQEKKYYQVNPDFVLYEEVRDLFIKAQILYGEDFIKKINSAGNIKLLVLTGIFVNNTNAPVDILAVGRFNRRKLLRLIKGLEKEVGKEINFSLMDIKEFKYRMEITDIFLYQILEGKKIVAINKVGLG